MHAEALRRCMEECDVAGALKLWAHIAPHLPQPTNAQGLVILHRARTETVSIAFKLRAYSHRWLLDNGYPSGLPDELKPKAERLYPQVFSSVGIALGGKTELAHAIKPHVMGAMQYAVLECYADGHQEPEIVKPRMFEAKAKITKQLLGRLALPV